MSGDSQALRAAPQRATEETGGGDDWQYCGASLTAVGSWAGTFEPFPEIVTLVDLTIGASVEGELSGSGVLSIVGGQTSVSFTVKAGSIDHSSVSFTIDDGQSQLEYSATLALDGSTMSGRMYGPGAPFFTNPQAPYIPCSVSKMKPGCGFRCTAPTSISMPRVMSHR